MTYQWVAQAPWVLLPQEISKTTLPAQDRSVPATQKKSVENFRYHTEWRSCSRSVLKGLPLQESNTSYIDHRMISSPSFVALDLQHNSWDMSNTFQKDCNMTSNHSKFHNLHNQLTQSSWTRTAGGFTSRFLLPKLRKNSSRRPNRSPNRKLSKSSTINRILCSLTTGRTFH